MRVVAVNGVREWRAAARALVREGVPADRVLWRDRDGAQASLLGDEQGALAREAAAPDAPLRVPRRFQEMADAVACHRDVGRWDALYRVLVRLTRGEPSLLEAATDPDVHRLHLMERAVRRAVHKMHAFVRFRAVAPDETAGEPDGERHFAAWFEPPHPVLARAVPLFVRRFAAMRWSILTPDACAHWDGRTLRFTPGVPPSLAPAEDALEELWRSYYAHIFNPARLATGAMRAEMPKRYWANLPEARLIAPLAREAPGRVRAMLARARAAPEPIPEALAARGAPAAPDVRAALDQPGAWDPVHDPGVRAARERAARVAAPAPRGLDVGGVTVRVGVAGWTDPTLTAPGVYYPDDVRTPEQRLRWHAARAPLVEVDATYYVMPSRGMAAAWAARTPEGFVFDVKAFALMTGHAADVNRLPDWLRRALPPSLRGAARVYARDLPTRLRGEIWRRFLGALEPLETSGRLGAVLLQFPRWFAPSRESAAALARAAERLGAVRGAVELRNPAWVEGRLAGRTLALLERLGLAWVIVDAPPGTRSSMPAVARLTRPDLAVVRLHGRRVATWEARNRIATERYRYLYDRAELDRWASTILEVAGMVSMVDVAQAKQGVHVVMNNCHANYGTTNADEITQILIERDALRRTF